MSNETSRISQHETLKGILIVDWNKDYHQDFRCPNCNLDQLTIITDNSLSEKCYFRCKNCQNKIKLFYQNSPHIFRYEKILSCPNPECTQLSPDGKTKGWIYLQSREVNGIRYKCHYCKTRFFNNKETNKPKKPLLSYHETINGRLTVDWRTDYHGEYPCLKCGSTQNYSCYNQHYPEKRAFRCKSCGNQTSLTCRNQPHIFKYQSHLNCPNPSCTQLSLDGKSKGWVYIYSHEDKGIRYKCHYCGIQFFNNKEESPNAWTYKNPVKAFQFDENTWDLRNFYKEVEVFTINFDFEPDWYRQVAKVYIQMLLKSRRYASGTIVGIMIAIKKFSQVVCQRGLMEINEINREAIRDFINSEKNLTPITLNGYLKTLRLFFEWLELESYKLIRSRDLLKERLDEPDWLDEKVRQEIHQHLAKITAPIARQYLIQEYTAARPGEVVLMPFDCLVEENSDWYIQFYQHKVQEWHRIPANREVRRVIEAQQQWIKEVLGNDYSYLFCHFRNLRRNQYPDFTGLMPLPKPPKSQSHHNTMVRVIRLLIEKEDIRDTNGLSPHFTGRITRASKLQEVRTKHGLKAAQLYANHKSSTTTLIHYAPPTQEQIAEVDLPFQELLLNPENKFLPWQSLPESLLKNPKAHELDTEIAPRLVVYGHCTLEPKTPCIYNLFPKCYGCSSFRPSTEKLPLYERQYTGEQQRMKEAKVAGEERAYEEAKSTLDAMDTWLPDLRKLADGE